MTSNFLFFGNGPYLNRGCEAIVRGTVEILRFSFGEDCQFTNAYFPQTENYVDVENDPLITPISLPSGYFSFPISEGRSNTGFTNAIISRLPYRIRTRLWFQKIWMQSLAQKIFVSPLSSSLSDCNAALALGGDNYTLDYGFPTTFLMLNLAIKKAKKPLAIWGASIGPFDKSPYSSVIFENFRKNVDLFFVREEISRDYLAKNGFTKNVHIIADPAFAMKPVSISVEKLGFAIPHEAFAFNISKLMAKYICEGKQEIWKQRAIEILRSILRCWERPIVLLPHVIVPGINDDYEFLSEIKNELREFQDRLLLVDNSFGAAELKWIISQCSCLIAARTHATIAAFSTAVPTVSLAYSTKAFGLNKKLFGHTDYLVPPTEMTPERITTTIQRMLDDSIEIKEKLTTIQNENNKLAFSAGEILRDFLQR